MHNFKIPEEEQKAFVTVEFELKDINIDDVIKQVDELMEKAPKGM